MKIKPVRWNKT